MIFSVGNFEDMGSWFFRCQDSGAMIIWAPLRKDETGDYV
jgi:hypothetical protein